MKRVGANQSGFTIVELLIVIVVIAILAAITLVSFNNITAQANESRRLSAMDDSEKLARMVMAERGDGVFSSGVVTYEVSGGNTVFHYPSNFPLMQVENYIPGDVKTGGIVTPDCLPGDYPATSVFNEGECAVYYLGFTKQGQSQETLLSRIVSTTAHWYTETVAPKYTAQVPKIPSDNLIQEVVNYGAVDYSETNPELGVGVLKSYKASRGVKIEYTTSLTNNSGNSFASAATVTGFSYTVPSNVSCGRGTKTLVDYGAIYGELLQMTDAELAAAAGATLADVPALRQQIQDVLDLMASQGTPLAQTTCKVSI